METRNRLEFGRDDVKSNPSGNHSSSSKCLEGISALDAYEYVECAAYDEILWSDDVIEQVSIGADEYTQLADDYHNFVNAMVSDEVSNHFIR